MGMGWCFGVGLSVWWSWFGFKWSKFLKLALLNLSSKWVATLTAECMVSLSTAGTLLIKVIEKEGLKRRAKISMDDVN